MRLRFLFLGFLCFLPLFAHALIIVSPSPPTASNVLFLPGIEGSRLYMKDALGVEQNLWEPSIINNISNLALNSDGTSEHEIYTRDIVDYIYGIKELGDVYGPFEDFMNSLVNDGVIAEWKAYPYDWRYDVNDIVTNGTLIGNSSNDPLTRVYLQDVVQELASTSPTGKVTIIAHSNGGLLAKALATELQKENKINLIDQIIFVGSPQFGTPLTIGSLLNGDGQTDATGGLIMYGGDVRTAAATMPGMYGLLPSSAYFTHDTDAPVLFPTNDQNNVYENYFGSQVNSQSTLENFLTDVPRLTANFPADDLQTPQVLSSQLLEKESETHALIDAWTPPSGVSVTSIAGWGNLTPFQYDYSSSDKKSLGCFRASLFENNCTYSYRAHHDVKNTESGDNTVVSVSAIGNPDLSQSFYFNAKTFSADGLGTIGHGDLTSAVPIETLIQSLITGERTSTSYISNSAPSDESQPLTVVSVHSPMNIFATDSSGNQTGIFPVPGKADIYFEKETIPGSSLQVLDDEKYLYLPQNAPYTISLQGYDDGETTLDLGTMDESGVTTTTEEFSNIPTTASSTIQFSIGSDSNSTFPTTINVDVFDNGSTTSIQENIPNADSVQIFSVLQKEFSALTVRRGIKNRFISELLKIEAFPDITSADAQNEISYLEKLIQAQIEIKLTNSQGIFFLKLLDQLKDDSLKT